MTTDRSACELCAQPGGDVLYRHAALRVVLVNDKNYPGFCRVIWNAHVQEMTDLGADDRVLLMETVWRVEAAIREVMQPDKINVASLGNMTPHLHWHVIPRYADDRHFPDAVWAAARRAAEPSDLELRMARLPELQQAIGRQLAQVI
ncbi:MAG TPA: HIT family protein [Burkholderiaceae bacterium]|jgi:diadenosine tetraphosphate (Ap4A) HIT family hydrolase|nr:HIT family protein [Burkholderiaceae bacterium]